MGVPKDPGFAAGLPVTRHAAFIHTHRGAQLGQGVRGAQADDPAPDHSDVDGCHRRSGGIGRNTCKAR
ncbi:hypothetical protein A5772_14665 [Mycolicibacter sinensis]|uniref:Uncharacterized protein n=1 Tax=Mycolicibacter sinensis (strain JDM601) TaxID=875328 RepID=A0A1A2F2S9_MYCSD|nr:hypothetical protein A5772_14665 [Mycolicibacter sinensis]OBG11094.1 hypothetical protein A5771_00020 [Mycolicibacter sinensis]